MDLENEKIKYLERGAHKGKGIAVFTSGGDSQGKYYIFYACTIFKTYLFLESRLKSLIW